MEIDHIFICTEAKAPKGDLLTEFGLVEGSSNTHPGQGTASRRFYFHNCMLEFLWVENQEEVQNESTSPMRLFERCQLDNVQTSPFGISFRPTDENPKRAPFQAWEYHPIYLPEHLCMQVAEHTPISEPMYFYLSFAGRQDRVRPEKREPMEHRVPLQELTAIMVLTNQETPLSEAAEILNCYEGFQLENGQEHLLVLEFDGGTAREQKDFRPVLPLILKW